MKKTFLILLIFVLSVILASCDVSDSKTAEFNWEPAKDCVIVTGGNPAGTVLMNNDCCKVTILDVMELAKGDFGNFFAYRLTCENKSDKTLIFKSTDLSVNGYLMYAGDNSQAVEPGNEREFYVWSYFPAFDSAIMKFEDFRSVEFTLRATEGSEYGDETIIIIEKGEKMPEIISTGANIVFYPQGEEQASYTGDRPSDNAVVLIDDKNITCIMKWFGLDESIYDKFYGYTAILYIENKTDKTLSFKLTDILIDGKKCSDVNFIGVQDVLGKHRVELWAEGFYYEGGDTAITDADKLEFKLNVYDKAEGKPIEGYGDIFTVMSE